MLIATNYKDQTTSIVRGFYSFVNNEVKLSKTISTNVLEINKVKIYNPAVTILKVPPKGGSIIWTNKLDKEVKHKYTFTASWTYDWSEIHGKTKKIDVIKVVKTDVDLKKANDIEFYKKGAGLVKIQIVDSKGIAKTLLEASQYSKEQDSREQLYHKLFKNWE